MSRVLATTVVVDGPLAPLIPIAAGIEFGLAAGKVGKKTAEAAPPASAATPSGAVG